MSPEDILWSAIRTALDAPRDRPLIVGICGAQGSGKTTVARALAGRVPGAVTVSIDDFYLGRDARMQLARDLHPLFATRGVPATHDIALAEATFAALDRGAAVSLPRFDKALDDRSDPAQWPVAPLHCPLVIFEGWCVGARPQPDDALATPINALEQDCDPQGVWRRHVNAALADYQPLFARVDMLVLLKAPDWETVLEWRLDQERALRRSGARGIGVMDDAAVATFVSHYERLTRHILQEMPQRADLVLQLGQDRSCAQITRRRPTEDRQ